MAVPRALLQQVAVFTRLVRENISLKSFRCFQVSRRLLGILILKSPINKILSRYKVLFEEFGGLYAKATAHFLFEMFNSKKRVSEISVSRFFNLFTSKPSQT